MSWFSNLGRKKKKEPSQNLTDVVRGIQWAVNSAVHATENQYISTMQRFFEKQEDGTYKAIEVEIKIDEQHTTKVPLLSLVNPNGLLLDKMKVEMAVKIKQTNVKHIYKDDIKEESDVSRSCFDVTFCSKNNDVTKRGDTIKLSMEFVAGNLPEGIARVMEHINNQIQPNKKHMEEDLKGKNDEEKKS
jgi:hypothetical protein